jgi:hypothetical protein
MGVREAVGAGLDTGGTALAARAVAAGCSPVKLPASTGWQAASRASAKISNPVVNGA